jgi:phospholipase C
MADDQALERLKKIKHIVVLMMENRSFDHMLGYLELEGMKGVNGLSGPDVNFNLDKNRKSIGIHAFDADGTKVQRPGEALQKKLDPDHSPKGVAVQVGYGYGDKSKGDRTMGGFVRNFIESRKPEDNVGPDLWSVPMGYYTSKDLPVYDYLANNYCVCDSWHSSIPGDTWPNRLYSIAGRAEPPARPGWLEKIAVGPLKGLRNAPIYDVDAFPRQLEDSQWRWYSHDPGTLRVVDGHYRDLDDLKRGNFAYFDRKKVSPVTELAESLIVAHDSFLDDAAKGELRDVSWIDPNFIDLSVLDPNSNDDHPPSDIRAGQALVLELYEALTRSPNWEDTLLVVVYDEHGGFYDHVDPPAVEDDGSGYKTLGVRVPALVVGPRVKKFVAHDVFDHTVLIKTILTRFAKDPDEAIAGVGKRVANSPHLGVLLEDEPRTDIGDHGDAREAIEQWRTNARARRQAAPQGAPSPAPDGAGQPFRLHEFQEDVVAFAIAMRKLGLPPGQP